MYGFSWGPVLIILVIVLILFGPKRLPELGESIGKAIKGFKKAHDDPESVMPKSEIPGGTASQATQMSTCSQCHKEYGGEFAFCPHCGQRVTKV
ncbi:MAG: twin-arginine translocase TatA/TatE family subunit [Deltaproteobacteria bacterium]|nr:twin-arginine translocase TatA/TatE family subunit [Deltaproteobacteria bacterium]